MPNLSAAPSVVGLKMNTQSLHVLGTAMSQSSDLTCEVSAMARVLDVLAGEGVQALSTSIHSFDTGGFTLLVGLAESHISVHTWPELGKVQMDVFLCSYRRDNVARCRRIFDAVVGHFKPTHVELTEVWRS